MTVKTAISLPDEVFAEIQAAASEQGQSRSALILTAVQKHLFDLETERLRKYLAELPDEVYALTDEERDELEWDLREAMQRLDEEDGGWPEHG